MFRLTIASADSRNTDIIDDNITPKQALENAGINYTRATVILDGCTMTPEKMNKSSVISASWVMQPSPFALSSITQAMARRTDSSTTHKDEVRMDLVFLYRDVV